MQLIEKLTYKLAIFRAFFWLHAEEEEELRRRGIKNFGLFLLLAK